MGTSGKNDDDQATRGLGPQAGEAAAAEQVTMGGPTPAGPTPVTPSFTPGGTPGHPDHPSNAGQLIAGRFELLALLGSGGMGTVYKALDRELGEPVALKMLRPDVVTSPQRLELLRQEARLARRVTHASIARTFDIGEHGQARFLTMEFIDGESLSAVLDREGPLSIERVATIVTPLCAGLTAAHAAGVIHRDLKPDNVMIGRDGRVVITDFGIARELSVGLGASPTSVGAGGFPVGTPAYMAPEQISCGAVDGRTDLYALGVMLFEMLTGARPWTGNNVAALLMARLQGPPPDPRHLRKDVPAGAAALIARCLALEPAGRPASAAEVASELQQLARAAAPAPAREPAAALPVLAGRSAREPVSLAVLPFRNAGQDSDAHWADGFTEDLIETLSLVPDLRIPSRGRVAALRASNSGLDPCELGRQLEVQAIAEGSVRRQGGRIRVQARLVSVHDGFQVWARRFDRADADLLDVVDEVAAALTAGLVMPEPAQGPGGFKDAATLELYLRGRQALHELSPEGIEHARRAFEQALASEPDEPRLLGGHALALSRLWVSGNFQAFEAVSGLARDEAERAKSLGAPAEAHLALATLANLNLDCIEAATEIRAALGKAPLMAELHEVRGRLLSEAGAFDEALAAFEQAQHCEPSLEVTLLEIARIHGLRGDLARCQSLLDARVARPPRTLLRIRLLLWKREVEQARQQMQAAAGASPLIARLGQAMFEGAVTSDGRHRRQVVFRQVRVEYLAAVGQLDEALAMLEEALGHRLNDLGWLDGCPLLVPLRGRPAFQRLRDEVERGARRVREVLLGPLPGASTLQRGP